MAGQEYWKKVKGEWVNTLALERAKSKDKSSKTAPVSRKPIERKGGGIELRGGGRAFYKGGKV